MELREAYQEKAYAQLCEWQAWIEQVKAGSPAARLLRPEEGPRMIALLEDLHRLALNRLGELREVQIGRWELAKQAVERAMIDLKQALDANGVGPSGRNLPLQDIRARVSYPFDRKG